MRLLLLPLFLFAGTSMLVQAEPPVNDDREDALVVVVDESVSGTMAEATLEVGEIVLSPQLTRSVWYRWTAENAGRMEWRVTSSSSTVSGEVYRVGGDQELVQVGQSGFYQQEEDEGGTLGRYPVSRGSRFLAKEGENFLFQVVSGDFSEIEFRANLAVTADGPVNETFEGALPLPGTVSRYQVEMAGALVEEGEPAATLPASVWFSWTAPRKGFWNFSTFGLNVLGLDVWRGETLSDLESAVVAGGAGLFSSTVVFAEAGETLNVRVLGESDSDQALTITKTTRGDMFSDAIDLGAVLEPGYTRGLGDRVTLELEEARDEGASQWFRWRVPQDGVYEFRNAVLSDSGLSYVQGLDSRLRVYEGDLVNELTPAKEISTGVSTRIMRFFLRKDQELKIRVSTLATRYYSTNDFGFNFGLGGVATFAQEVRFWTKYLGLPPSNDDFENADDLGKTRMGRSSGTTVAATTEVGDPIELGYSGRPRQEDTVWVRWAAPEDGEFELRVETEARLTPELFRGTTLAELEKLGGQGYTDRYKGFRIQVEKDEVYYLRMRGDGYGAQGEYEVVVEPVRRPANDDFIDAIELTGIPPLSARGTTVFGSVEAPLEVHDVSASELASIWWKWTAEESGFYQVEASTTVNLMEDGRKYGGRFSGSDSSFNFEAIAGSEYHFRATNGRESEGQVDLRLRRVEGLNHTTADTALIAPAVMAFTTETVVVRGGIVLLGDQKTSGAVWYRWTPPSTGWVRVKVQSSTMTPNLSIRPVDESPSMIALPSGSSLTRRKFSRGRVSNYPRQGAVTGFLNNPVVSEGSQVPALQASFSRVEAGVPYYLVASPGWNLDDVLADISLQVEVVSERPELRGEVTYQSSMSGSVLYATMSVFSPNGFVGGQIAVGGQSVNFGESSRVQGDAFEGEYRITIPWVPSATEVMVRTTVSLWDRKGMRAFEQIPETVLEQTITEGSATDIFGPGVVGVQGAPLQLAVGDEAMTFDLEIAVVDHGGSGFVRGEILIPGSGGAADSPSVIYTGPLGEFVVIHQLADYGLEDERRISFGSENRIRGDEQVGIYRVSIPIPAYNPPGRLRCRLQDQSGNMGGQWITSGSRLSVPSSRF